MMFGLGVLATISAEFIAVLIIAIVRVLKK
jgi:hypothetical protein